MPGAISAIAVALAAATSSAPPPAPLSSADAAAIVQALGRGRQEGLALPDPRVALAALGSDDPAARTAGDATLSGLAVALARAEHGMRIDPQSVDKRFALRPAYDAASDFANARQAGRIAAWAAQLAPSDPLYADLVAARSRYLAIIAAGGWPMIPAGRPVKAGEPEPRAAILRQRLTIEGYVVAAPAPPPDAGATNAIPQTNATAPATPPVDRYDTSLVAAVRDFQTAHGLKPDGMLTPDTLAALNTAPAARLAAIDANLERERWLPQSLPPNRIEVDTGDPVVTLFEDGAAALTMRAIVGQPKKQTPTFASKVVAIEFNPPWIVPADIAAKELYPKEARSPGYLARNDFYVADGQLIQKAGPKSSLGYLKFDIPDPFDVYLHDTPARTLFALDRRWLSHGCIRLENPRDLAAALVAPQGGDRASIDAGIAAGATYTVRLSAVVPVFVVYRTVVADAAGHATFRHDVYGWDAELEAALAPFDAAAKSNAPS